MHIYLYISAVLFFILIPILFALLLRAIYSQKVQQIYIFGGYAMQQMYRLRQLTTNKMPQADLEEHILHVLSSMEENFAGKYSTYPDDAIKLYIDTAVQKGFDKEIFMDVKLHHYPLRDYCCLWNELQTTVKSYAKAGKRNEKAAAHKKNSKALNAPAQTIYDVH